MALMDMAEIEPLMRAMSRLLKPGGRFVFSVTHPCFNHTGITKFIEEVTQGDGTLAEVYGVKVTRYVSFGEGTKMLGTGIIGQPMSQYYFERTLSGLLAAGFKAGLALDGLEEPAFGPDAPSNRAMSWVNFGEISPFMVARMRAIG
jgi:SAM-dependent methyltransferase